jgi:hypothetical protein
MNIRTAYAPCLPCIVDAGANKMVRNNADDLYGHFDVEEMHVLYGR